MSTASPLQCCDFSEEPIAFDNSGHLYPEVIIIGLSIFSLNGYNICVAIKDNLGIISSEGVLSIPSLSAVCGFVNSFKLKCFVNCISISTTLSKLPLKSNQG